MNELREALAGVVIPRLHRAADMFEDAADRAGCWSRPRPPGLHTCGCWHWRRLHRRRSGACLLCCCTCYRATWLNIAGQYTPMKSRTPQRVRT